MSEKPVFRLLAGDSKMPASLRVPVMGCQERGRSGTDFSFTYLAAPLACHCEMVGENAVLRVSALIGPIPYTAESIFVRVALFKIIEAANDRFGGVFSIRDGEIRMDRSLEFQTLSDVADIVAATAALLTPLGPYIELIGNYIAMPAEAENVGMIRPAWRRAASS